MSALAKPRPKLLDKRDAKAKTAKLDREENAKVKQRSGGQCEVRTVADYSPRSTWHSNFKRCPFRASHTHHLISGIGRRNVGKSILAAHKLHVCERCHEEIHGHVLKPVNDYEREDAATVRYERVE
jgi:hypothetical protein